MPIFAGSGVTPSLKGLTSNVFSLAAGASWIIPSGYWQLALGKYTCFQEYDPISGLWRTTGTGFGSGDIATYFSDGVNYRLANQSGCAVGALLTTAGSGYTSAPVVTASAGSSIWRAIVGGALNTTVTVTNGGTGYTYPPIVVIQAPPPGGVQATATCALTSGAVSSVTIVDQGAGYSSPPIIQFINDPREGVNGVAQGVNAAAVATLTGAGTVTAVVCLDHGAPQTAVPTLAFSGGGGSSAAATAIMNFAVTGYTVTTAGAGLNGANAILTAIELFPTTAPAYTNVSTQSGLLRQRNANIKMPISAGSITATGLIVYDGGCYSAVPGYIVNASASVVTTAPVPALTVGGLTDVSAIFST